jgi:hypothetical protein
MYLHFGDGHWRQGQEMGKDAERRAVFYGHLSAKACI